MARKAQIDIPYRPMPKQAAAHALVAKYRGYCGGWGNGKTSWGCVEVTARLSEFPRTRCIVARKTRPELKSTTWDMLLHGDPDPDPDRHPWTGIPKALIKVYNKSDLFIELHNGSQIYGLPLDKEAKLENYNLGFFWIDQAEEIEEDMFLKFHGRLRQRVGPREGILTWNPAGHNWLWRRFIDPKRKLKWHRLYRAIEATTFDNFNLPEDYFDAFEGLPDAWLQRYVFGSHDVFVGQIFTDWDEDVHVCQPFKIPSWWERWQCYDPGMRHEGALSWIARDEHGNAFYYREHLETGRDAGWWAQKCFEMERENDWGGPEERIHRRLAGPEVTQRSQATGKSVLDILNAHGLYPEMSDKQPNARISIVTEYLRENEEHRNPFTGEEGSPKLFVFADCHKLLEYLPQYRWRPQRVNYSEEEVTEAPRKKDDHNIDNLGHMLLAFDGLPPVTASQRRHVKTEAEEFADLFRAELEAAQGGKNGARHDLLGVNY